MYFVVTACCSYPMIYRKTQNQPKDCLHLLPPPPGVRVCSRRKTQVCENNVTDYFGFSNCAKAVQCSSAAPSGGHLLLAATKQTVYRAF